jgi:hypothetical protein
MWNIIGISLMKTSPIDELRDERQHHLSSLIDGWSKPSMVRVEGDNLICSARSESANLTADQLFEPLRSFIALDGADGKRIARFAQRWGVLGICEHGLPASHNTGVHVYFGSPLWDKTARVEYQKSCFPMQLSDGLYSEPLAEWRFWTELANRIVRIGADLQSNQPGKTSDWQAMGYEPWHFEGLFGGNTHPSMPPPLGFGKVLLADYITEWLVITGVNPAFYWSRGRWIFKLGTSAVDKLLATIGVQMLLLINRSTGFSLFQYASAKLCAFSARL